MLYSHLIQQAEAASLSPGHIQNPTSPYLSHLYAIYRSCWSSMLPFHHNRTDKIKEHASETLRNTVCTDSERRHMVVAH